MHSMVMVTIAILADVGVDYQGPITNITQNKKMQIFVSCQNSNRGIS